jgi:mRNA interferase RelE/StbE
MAYRVETSPAAQRQWRKLPGIVQERVAPAILELADDPRPQGCEKLTGSDSYRIRVGDYRVGYGIDDGERVITITKIEKRESVYR